MSKQIISEIVQSCLGSQAIVRQSQTLAGGDMSAAYKVSLQDHQQFVLKLGTSADLEMFQAEKSGLEQLAAAANILQIPRVVAAEQWQGYSYILMQYFSKGQPKSDFTQQLAKGLAELHQAASSHGKYGFGRATFCGRTRQNNVWEANWVNFFRENRLDLQVDLLKKNNLVLVDVSFLGDYEILREELDNLLPDHPLPCLLHGDLWSGNVISGDHGQPALIDPAVYYGHNETDIAFSRLFGGFGNDFYQAYQEILPFESGYLERFNLYNIYHLLNHANLFYSRSYLSQGHQLMKRFV